MAKQAVLLLAHGTPETAEQIPEYLRNVVGGRPMPQTAIEEIQRRYALIGHSPLTEISLEQGRLVEAELANSGHPAPVYVAMRNWRPTIPDVISKMRADGVTEASVLCLAPQNSRVSVGRYRRAVEAESAGLRLDFTGSWAEHPLLIEAFAERLFPAWISLSAQAGTPVPVLFTAHSVPCRTVEDCAGQTADSYAEEARRTAALITEHVPEIQRGSRFRRKLARSHCRRDTRRHRSLGRPHASASAHRLSLRSRRNPLRRGHSPPRLCRQTGSPAGAAGVAERFKDSRAGDCGSGAPGAGAARESLNFARITIQLRTEGCYRPKRCLPPRPMAPRPPRIMFFAMPNLPICLNILAICAYWRRS